MILESQQTAYKIVQSVMNSDEKLVWAGGPRLQRVLLSAIPLSFLGIGLVGLLQFVLAYFNLDSGYAWKFRDLEAQQSASMVVAVIASLCLLGWPICAFALAKAEGIYGITTKRILLIYQKKQAVFVREARLVNSVSTTSSRDGHGSVVVDVHDGDSLNFNYLDHVSTIATLVAETFGIPFDKATAKPTVANETASAYERLASCFYWSVREKRGQAAALASITLWLGYLLLTWVWLGSVQSYLGHSWIWFSALVFLSVTVTKGLIVQLKNCLKTKSSSN
ncbi:MAG TPA: hypothetical protein V6C69_19630 [Trichormus sp.]|jgi:hypothetical protein